MPLKEDFFDDLEYETVDLADENGEIVPTQFPILQRNGRRVGASFLVSAEKVQELLPPSLTPLSVSALTGDPLPEGKTPMSIMISEKRDFSDENPDTNEWLIAFNAPWNGAVGWFTYMCGESSEQILKGIKRAWNYKGFVCDVVIEEEAKSVTATVTSDGQTLLTLKVPKGRPSNMTMDGLMLSAKDDGQIITYDCKMNLDMAMAMGSKGVELTWGDHPLAESLQALEIEPASSSHYVPAIQMSYGKPRSE
jgi:hypothetical protein